MRCWSCGQPTDVRDGQRVEFRATCAHCDAWLHACKGCKHYNPHVSQACDIPNVDYVGDKERGNRCEYFEAKKNLADVASLTASPSDDAAARFKKLFGG